MVNFDETRYVLSCKHRRISRRSLGASARGDAFNARMMIGVKEKWYRVSILSVAVDDTVWSCAIYVVGPSGHKLTEIYHKTSRDEWR